MSRSRINPRKHRKKVHNKYLQKILHIWYDDFGGTRGKNRTLSRLVRKREKNILKKEINDYENK